MEQFPSGMLPITVSQDRDISNQDLAFKNILLGSGTHQTKSISMTDFSRVGLYKLPMRGVPQKKEIEYLMHNFYIYLSGKLLKIKYYKSCHSIANVLSNSSEQILVVKR